MGLKLKGTEHSFLSILSVCLFIYSYLILICYNSKILILSWKGGPSQTTLPNPHSPWAQVIPKKMKWPLPSQTWDLQRTLFHTTWQWAQHTWNSSMWPKGQYWLFRWSSPLKKAMKATFFIFGFYGYFFFVFCFGFIISLQEILQK